MVCPSLVRAVARPEGDGRDVFGFQDQLEIEIDRRPDHLADHAVQEIARAIRIEEGLEVGKTYRPKPDAEAPLNIPRANADDRIGSELRIGPPPGRRG